MFYNFFRHIFVKEIKNKLITNAQITTNCCYSLWWVFKNKCVMSEDFIKEAKNFKRQMKWCSIICWFTTALLTYKAPDKVGDWGIVIFGAIVFTIIYFNMSKNISSYEK